MAVALTGVPSAGDVLASLARRNYFTNVRLDAEPVYQYHDLFREFLQAQARAAFAPAERADVQRRAAILLADAGEFAAAASLFHKAADWEGLACLIERQAGEMLRQGRNQTIEEWLASLPQDRVAEKPWLLYWRGMCRLPSDPGRAREDFDARPVSVPGPP
jgi:LuxR family maltose regulon positive regulatory protein